MRVLALEPFDERGGFRRDGAGLAAILPRFGRERFQAVAAIAQGPIQQRVHRDLRRVECGNVVEAGGDFLRAAREFAARQCLQHQRRDEAVAEEGDFFGFVVHGVFSCHGKRKVERPRGSMQMVCGEAQPGRGGGGECGAAAVGSQTAAASPAGGAHAGEQEAVSGDPAGGFEHAGALDEVGRGAGVVNAASAAHSASACARKRRSQNWPRW
jgi:hypothetical protein